VSVDVLYETHSLTEDNEAGRATGWLDGRLSARGCELARKLGERHRADPPDAVFTSDLGRSLETVAIAFGAADAPVFHDWRLRECDYGELNGAPVDVVHAERERRLDEPYPGGESWRGALDRVDGCLDDLAARWDGARLVLIGHVATRFALDRRVHGATLEELMATPFAWREGWRYAL
jgi:2,3-bisphosphoglycerate-dependent phosphoglycerate mutase